MSFAHANFLANQTLYVDQDVEYQSIRKERSDLYITRQDQVHHQQTFILGQYPVTLTPYPTNITIQRCLRFNGARNKGVHDLRGSNSIWVSAIILDVAQKCHGEYPRKGILQGRLLDVLIVVEDRQADWTLITLIDKGLYDRRVPEIRNIPEERVMRYTVVCMSMLADQVSLPGDT